MANTRMTARNTFSSGLVMDFNPTITRSDVLVNALNATLLTFNGNEMQIQQDMGNGRVETAFLPEGYIPVGACEFGDIIYIVSYNPLEDKSQIGCFPSPERNISSDEVTDMQQSLSAGDFQFFHDGKPTGELKSLSAKKILYGNKNMNPGDKYIIYEEGEAEDGMLRGNFSKLSDAGNSNHKHGEWPKLVKVSVVSIEDTGKIVNLNSSIKWYDDDYYITNLTKTTGSDKPDIDSYRSLVSSAYSIFQSRVSGKLAILAELEVVDSFNLSYNVYTTLDNDTLRYNIYFNTSWTSRHNDISPIGFIFTSSDWASKDSGGHLIVPSYNTVTDTIEYIKDVQKFPLPVLSGKRSNGFDYSKVFTYNRLYKVENVYNSYDTYKSSNFEYKVNDIVKWNGLVPNNALGNLRHITKITRVLDRDTGEPVKDSNGKYTYVFNVDSYELVDGKIQYLTKNIEGNLVPTKSISLDDDVVNHHFKKDVPMLVSESFSLPIKKTLIIDGKEVSLPTDLSNMIWNYSVAPAMPFGVLDNLSLSGTIDFSKIGTGDISLTQWRYYNSGEVSTLTWGLDAYLEPNKGIAGVVFDFYDNQGHAAGYHITDKSSYSGTFTENIIFNRKNSSFRLSSIDAYGNTSIHAGLNDISGSIYLTPDNKPTTNKTTVGPFLDDSGTLYPNILYLVRITVKYCSKDILGNFDTSVSSGYKTFYRWFWSNNMFNEHYYDTFDFDVLKPNLGFDFSATFDSVGGINDANEVNPLVAKNTLLYNNVPLKTSESTQLYKTLYANVYHINQDGADDTRGNIKMTLNPSLVDGFNTFYLNKDNLHLIDNVEVSMGKSSITNSSEQISIKRDGEYFGTPLEANIQPVIAKHLNSYDSNNFDRSGYASYNYGINNCVVSQNTLNSINAGSASIVTYPNYNMEQVYGDTNTDIYSSQSAYRAYIDSFSLNMLDSVLKTDKSLEYLNSKGEQESIGIYQTKRMTMQEASTIGVKLVLSGTMYSKVCSSEAKEDNESKVLRSLIYKTKNETNGPEMLGLHYYQDHLYFNDAFTISVSDAKGYNTRYSSASIKNIKNDSFADGEYKLNHARLDEEDHKDWMSKDIQSLLKPNVVNPISALMFFRDSRDIRTSTIYSEDTNFRYLKRSFGLSGVGADRDLIKESYRIPESDENQNWKNSIREGVREFAHCLLVRDSKTNEIVLVSDYFYGSDRNPSQNKRLGSTSDVHTGTLADMVGSLFSQTYILYESVDEQDKLCIVFNTLFLDSYVQSWHKDIVIRFNNEGSSLSAQDNVYKLLTIQRQTMRDYLMYLKANMGIAYNDSLVNKSNISIGIVSTNKVFEFKFDIPYNATELLSMKRKAYTSRNILHSSVLDENGNRQTHYFSGDVKPNTLYVWTGTTIQPFGANAKIYYASSFKNMDDKLYMTSSKGAIKSTSFNALSKIIQYDGGSISFHNLSQIPTWNTRYNLIWDSEEAIQIKEIPSISFFNLFNPGK